MTTPTRAGVEELLAMWWPMPRPLLIGPYTARNLVRAAQGWFTIPEGYFRVVP